MRKNVGLALLTQLVALLLVAAPSFAQNVFYSGTLKIGFGDQDNTVPTGLRSNNAIPICAGNSAVNPASLKPAGTTLGTLVVNGRGTATPGVGGAVTFHAIGSANADAGGGAQQYDNSTCNVAIPGFVNPRLRSRTQVGAANWPGRRGEFLPGAVYTNQTVGNGTEMVFFADADPPATPTASYVVSAAGGNPAQTASGAPVSAPYSIMLTQVRTINLPNSGTISSMSTSMQTTPFPLAGSGAITTIPFFGAGGGFQIIDRGNGFGGGVPFSGGGGVQLGVNLATVGPTGMTLALGDYGLVPYANGFLPTDPQMFGTGMAGRSILNPQPNYVPPTFTPTLALHIGRQDLSYALRTKGGPTKDDQGKIQTPGGGNTVTPFGTAMLPVGTTGGTEMNEIIVTFDCVNGIPAPCPAIISPVAFSGFFGNYTTGTVRHVDQVGDFVTIRTAMGTDQALVPSSGNGFATRNLQLVAPWSASIKPVGAFGLSQLLPDLGFGGVSILDINIIPAPEPGSVAMLGFGALGLVGLGRIRRRN